MESVQNRHPLLHMFFMNDIEWETYETPWTDLGGHVSIEQGKLIQATGWILFVPIKVRVFWVLPCGFFFLEALSFPERKCVTKSRCCNWIFRRQYLMGRGGAILPFPLTSYSRLRFRENHLFIFCRFGRDLNNENQVNIYTWRGEGMLLNQTKWGFKFSPYLASFAFVAFLAASAWEA